jgi:hypothetical protein
MPTIADLKRVLANETPEQAEDRRRRLADALRVPDIAASMQWQAEKEVAPVVTRDAVLALVEESRSQARWGRRMFWLAAANVALTLINIFIFVAR